MSSASSSFSLSLTSASSSPTDARRSNRVRSSPHRLEHDQESDAAAIADLLAIRRAISSFSIEDNDSDESDAELVSSSDSDVEDEKEEKVKETQKREPTFDWSLPPTPGARDHAFVPPLPTCSASDLYTQCSSPLDFFHAILPLSFIDHIVEHMNLYANEYYAQQESRNALTRAQHQHESERRSRWEPTTQPEVLAFIGCIMYMSIVNLSCTRDYWRKETEQVFVTNVFPRTRFFRLLHFFHLADNALEEIEIDSSLSSSSSSTSASSLLPRNPLYKINPIIDQVLTNSQRLRAITRHITIDEAMCGYKGKSKMRQYIATKAQDTGFKVWMAVECETGYVFNFDVYTGKYHSSSEAGQGARVVKMLLRSLPTQSWFVVYVDNFFTSVKLFRDLYEKGYYAVGTMRSNRMNFPLELQKGQKRITELEQGQFEMKESQELACYTWKDKRPVHFLSSFCDPTKLNNVKRRVKGERERRNISCPEVVVDYTRWMRGVDVFSQREAYFRVGRRARKWWPRLAWFVVAIGLNNAYVLHQLAPEESRIKMSQKEWRVKLMEQLVNGFSCRVGAGRPVKKRRRVDGAHTPIRMKRGPCIVCQQKTRRVATGGHNKRAQVGCKQCDVNVCLDCFEKHQQLSENELGEDDEEDDSRA